MSYPAPDPATTEPSAKAPPTLLDVQPFLERRADSIWARVEQARDDLCDALQQACEQEGFDALVIKSGPFVQPAWVKLESWIPKNPAQGRAVTERGSVVVTIEAKEFHRYELEYKVEVHDRGWSKTYRRLRSFGPAHAVQLARFVLRRGLKPALAELELRRWAFELWKPKNKVDVLSTDWLGMAPIALAGLGLVLVGLGFGMPLLLLLVLLAALLGCSWLLQRMSQQRPVVIQRSMKPIALTGWGFAAIGLGVVVFGPGFLAFAITVATISPIGLLFLIGAGVTFFFLRKRRVVVLSSGKPKAEPRTLHLVDSWQAVISGLGDDAVKLRERFLAVLQNPPMAGFQSRVEQIWHWGLDGKVEREQTVLTLRRGILFCQIYEYDQELYVGWDAHLNSGQWVEKTVVHGIHKQTGELTQVNTVQSWSQVLGEYDVTDINCLLEWTHAQLVRLVQRLMEERQIDQEIDFKIIRGKRQDLTKPQETGEGVQQATRRVARKLVRTG